MIGLIFNTLEKVVIREFGEDTWDLLIEEAASDGIYHAFGNYPDDEATRMVVIAAEKLGLTPEQVLKWFGDLAITEWQGKWPDLFDRFNNLFDYVLSLNDIIHPHVKELYPNANVPQFNLVSRDEHSMTIEYCSERSLCHLAEGLIMGSARVFGEHVAVLQPQCVHKGDPICHLSITQSDQAAA